MNTNSTEKNLQSLVGSIIMGLYQIIINYIGKQNSNEIRSLIEGNINKFLENLYNNEDIREIINHYKTDFMNQYNNGKNAILSNYNITINEVNTYLNNKINQLIKEIVIIKIITKLSEKIYSEYNSYIVKYFEEEIKNIKKTTISINIPAHLINSIQDISDKIYQKLGNISDDEEEILEKEEVKKENIIKNNANNKDKEKIKKNNKKNIDYLINDDD